MTPVGCVFCTDLALTGYLGASSSRSQVRALPPCRAGRLTLAQLSASVHWHSLAAGGIITRLVARASSGARWPGRLGTARKPEPAGCGMAGVLNWRATP
jgi:hypothetical protein